MKVSIITIHNIYNFGSVFQAYALYKYLCNKGYDVEIIDYNPAYFRKKTVKSLLAKFLYYNQYKIRKRKFNNFINQNILLSRKYLTFNDLLENPPASDIYISGGDQLWNSYYDCGKDPAYKLKFVQGYKISYGTSMGRENYSIEELQKLKEDLFTFYYISVREHSSEVLLKSVDVQATQVVDPVLLLQKEDYQWFVKKPDLDKYLFVYLVKPSILLSDTVAFLSKTLGLKVVLYGGFKKKCKCDYFLKDLGPDEVLSYLICADYVLSASFHATLFCILFHKQFCTLLPDENTNNRIEDILGWCGLQDRIARNQDSLNNHLLDTIDYIGTDIEIEKRVRYSKNWLEEALGFIRI